MVAPGKDHRAMAGISAVAGRPRVPGRCVMQFLCKSMTLNNRFCPLVRIAGGLSVVDQSWYKARHISRSLEKDLIKHAWLDLLFLQ